MILGPKGVHRRDRRLPDTSRYIPGAPGGISRVIVFLLRDFLEATVVSGFETEIRKFGKL